VTFDYEPPFRWTGTLHSVRIDVPPPAAPDVAAQLREALRAD
jgi:hypothetical protein